MIPISAGLIFIAVFSIIMWNNRGTPEDRQFRQNVAQLKRNQKELDRLRKMLYD